MTTRTDRNGLQVDANLAAFIEGQALPGTGVAAEAFWAGFSDLVHQLGPKNRGLLAEREAIQAKIDDWHKSQGGKALDMQAYTSFLREVGYIVEEGAPFELSLIHISEPTRPY